MSQILLPKVYEIRDNTPEKYHKYVGYPKLSYSQYTSWKDPMYREGYIKQYLLKQEVSSPFQRFADFGSACGEYIETQGGKDNEMLSAEDKAILDKIDYSGDKHYEEEIVVPVKDKAGNIMFVIQGFIDEIEYLKAKTVRVIDFKTGNADKKVEQYASQDYGQTTLYCFSKTLEGFKIEYSGVILLGRKGNGYPKYPLKLSGENVDIPTKYSKTRANKVIKDMTKVAREISEYYVVIQKLKGL